MSLFREVSIFLNFYGLGSSFMRVEIMEFAGFEQIEFKKSRV